MTQETRVAMAQYLNAFPEARWDRFMEYDGHYWFYGWIDREDGKADLLVIMLHHEQYESYFTTSQRYSLAIANRLEERFGLTINHIACQRIEDLDLPVNAIKLESA